MLGISTAWTAKAQNGQELLAPILDIGIGTVELGYMITEGLLAEIRPRIKGGEIEVLSIHNYFPAPEGFLPERWGGDAFSLSSLDEEERRKGVFYTNRTIEQADDLGARVVILHLGRVEIGLPPEGLTQLFREGFWEREGKELLVSYQKERRRLRDRHLDRLFFCLERIVKRAEQLGVRLGIENRYYLHEIPDSEEIGIILHEFRGAPIGYWHDTGHAAAMESLGIIRQEELLKQYASFLVGVHLHDCKGIEDHKSPGLGDVPFATISSYIPEDAIKILEVHPSATRQEVMDGIAILKEKGLG